VTDHPDHPSGKTFGERMSEAVGEDVFAEAMAGLAQSEADPSVLNARRLWNRLPDRPVNANEVAVVLPEGRRLKVYGTFYSEDYDVGETAFERLLVEGERFHYLALNARTGTWERVGTSEKGEYVDVDHIATERPFSYWLAREVARDRLSWPDETLMSHEGDHGVTLWDIAEVSESRGRMVRRNETNVPLTDEQVRDLRERLVVEVDA
jgi:hypothetical protein